MINVAMFIPHVVTAIGCTSGIKAAWKYRTPKDVREIKEKWNYIMNGAGIKNKAENKDTFKIIGIEKKKYGYELRIGIPFGIPFEKLEEIKPIIETNYGCEIELEPIKNFAILKIYDKEFDSKDFEIVKTKPYELFFGYDREGKPVIADMLKTPHVLISGAPNWGKTYAILIALTNATHQHESIDIHIIQISDKPDFVDFIGIKQLKSYIEYDYNKAVKELEDLLREKQKRNELLKKHNCKTIKEYNEKFPKNPMHYKFVVTDEFSNYMPGNRKTDKYYDIKSRCMEALKKIAKEARSCGIYLITAMQRPDMESMDGDMKNCFNCRIAFHANNVFSSRTMIDSDDAVDLGERECIVLTNKRYKIKTPCINSTIIKSYLKNMMKTEFLCEAESTFTWTEIKDNIIPLKKKEDKKGNEVQPKRRRRDRNVNPAR